MELYTLIGPPHLFFVFSFSYFQRWLTRGRGIIVDWDLWKFFFFFLFCKEKLLDFDFIGLLFLLFLEYCHLFMIITLVVLRGFPTYDAIIDVTPIVSQNFFFFLCSDWLDGIFSHIIFHFFSVFFNIKKNKLKRKLI